MQQRSDKKLSSQCETTLKEGFKKVVYVTDNMIFNYSKMTL